MREGRRHRARQFAVAPNMPIDLWGNWSRIQMPVDNHPGKILTPSLLKRAAISAIRCIVGQLPGGTRVATLDRLIDRQDWFLTFSQLAKEFGVVAVKVAGEYGVIEGNPRDAGVLRGYAETGRWADRTNRRLIEFFAEAPGTYIDIGANIGLTTIPIARRSGMHCVAIEPDPANFACLASNVTTNCTQANVTLYNLAIADANEPMHLSLSPDSMGDHRLTRNGPPDRRVIIVDCRRLDDLGIEVSKRLAVKIDTQGSEPLVVAGGGITLSGADLLILEFCPYLMRQLGADPEVVIRFIENNFVKVTLAYGEDGPSFDMPMGKVAEVLRRIARDQADELSCWFDVTAEK